MSFFSKGAAKDKLAVMYLLEKLRLEPTRAQLGDLSGTFDLIPYFDLQTAVLELEEDGFIAAVPRSYGQAYCLTPGGKETLDTFKERLTLSFREELGEYADKYRDKIRRENHYYGRVEKADHNARRAVLKARERDVELLTLDILLPDSATANRAIERWPERAEAIYAAIMAELNRE